MCVLKVSLAVCHQLARVLLLFAGVLVDAEREALCECVCSLVTLHPHQVAPDSLSNNDFKHSARLFFFHAASFKYAISLWSFFFLFKFCPHSLHLDL